VLASLNHAHIGAIYGLEEFSPVDGEDSRRVAAGGAKRRLRRLIPSVPQQGMAGCLSRFWADAEREARLATLTSPSAGGSRSLPYSALLLTAVLLDLTEDCRGGIHAQNKAGRCVG
jgi:hypothetical protein